MLISFSRDGSLVEAVAKTFDGEHPCPLCKAVDKGQKQDQEKSVQVPMKKLDAVLLQDLQVVAPAPAWMTYALLTQQGERRVIPPLWTPPRQCPV
jgi:hypothetical protein